MADLIRQNLVLFSFDLDLGRESSESWSWKHQLSLLNSPMKLVWSFVKLNNIFRLSEIGSVLKWSQAFSLCRLKVSVNSWPWSDKHNAWELSINS